MRDPEFEKHVQEKLGELQFPPSEAVWQNVDNEINKEKINHLQGNHLRCQKAFRSEI